MSTSTRMTADEYFAVSVEGDRTELIAGELVVNEPRLEHGLAQGNLYKALSHWADTAPGRGAVLLPADVVVDEFNVYGPDLLWLREERVPAPFEGRLSGLPDLAVEIRSASTWRYVVGAKQLAYERAGLPELWFVDNLADSVMVFRRSGRRAGEFDVALELTGSEQLTLAQLPGFAVAVERLFRR